MPVDVSVIIVNYKTPELTAAAIRSVFEHTRGVSFDISVVDNQSEDGSVQVLHSEFGDNITIIEAGGNIGFGRANNIAIEKTQSKYVFLLNSDTLLKTNAIKIFYDFIERTPRAGVCGGNLFDKEDRPTHSYGQIPKRRISTIFPLWKRIKRVITRKDEGFNYSKKIKEVGYITGADMFVRREAIDKSGIFDPDYFMYGEEVELTYRIKKAGYDVYSVPSAEITHLVRASTGVAGECNENTTRLSVYGEFLFFEKAFGKESVYKRYKQMIRANFYMNAMCLLLKSAFFKKKKIIYTEVFAEWKEKREKNYEK